MRNILIFVIVLITFSACSSAIKKKTVENKSKNIFRYANFGDYGKIVLGKQFERQNHPGVPIGKRAYKLRSGTYSGAERITIFVDDKNRVVSMRFVYAEDHNFEGKIKSYTESLGKPIQHDTGKKVEKVIWQDEYTRFELVRKSTDEMYSILTDLKK